ncbi:MAG: pyroglutamyl-peptidase I [Rothia sp. (in: high G+C Gram-positive bacteria)]|uniref:pyroglutamyl-peptidase I n=1 Tax=Rothia sp. (in: high G+C Gram-positive bacteria) TaxID=1885016 RepID=UPI0026E01A7A|nr:pyroglutamyl-peptidase I [Rothia sp. (in: high G+C Gram-positive bacteria)]MDO5750073.1 pyroglutamyl-peptidase I [Rothia sp. (in: high G+C Gram-positive bacteria)]
MRLLLTCFGPFPGVPVNPTQRIAAALVAVLGEEANITLRELPVSYAGSSAALESELAAETYDAVLSLGVAVGRSRIGIERVAINLDDARIEDNDGVRLHDAPIAPGGPAAYFSTLPVRALYESARAAGYPVEISDTAGTYVCNHVMYTVQHLLAESGAQIPAGFIHIPAVDFASSDEGNKVESMTAHRDAGGVEGHTIPTLPERTVVNALAHMIRELASSV